ncbi:MULTISPECIES: hypothetical protein [unclassified Tychonema]|uniref:hypothetical protein n=1 Tax=unclassified Tychonema TaxID=2642144 RepID=UPI00187FAC34|nr:MULTISPECIES: hypothetical protein [unclassified Tychonema]MBE9131915.1 hypothetical protein [Tychonema sp. LEGE 07196]MBE9162569.1 hypothetical protein [Tychonema sp. LEGE 06208]
MEPVTLTAGAIATLVLIKATETATEKATEQLGKLVVEKGHNLLSLLKRESPSTATAIELSQQQPLDYRKAVLELEAATNPEVAKAVEEVDTAVGKDAKLASAVKALTNALQSQPPSVQNYGKIAEEIKEIKALIQGNVYGDINIV